MSKDKAALELVPQQNLSPVTRSDMEAMQAQRALLKEFVQSQLKEANFNDPKSADYGDGDFGIIPGTKKKVLLKPGAEKLLQLFNFGMRFKALSKEIDRHQNFALFEYECEVYHRRTGLVLANCVGTANSQEVKYRERTVWKKKVVNGKTVSESVKEETPIFDVLNTLSKMAQKRALVGATILATAASDYFTQDLEPEEAAKPEPQAQAAEPKDVTESVQSEPPTHTCGRKMMLSKYPNRETGQIDWYCIKCKESVPQGEA